MFPRPSHPWPPPTPFPSLPPPIPTHTIPADHPASSRYTKWVQVQEEMLKVHWRDDVLSLPQCQAQVGAVGDRNQGVIFLGPRIKMGIYEGTPTRVAPHTTTGSTDYFGPFVNR